MLSALLWLQILAFAGIAVAMVRPELRSKVVVGLTLLGIGGLLTAAMTGVQSRSLAISHRFSAYVDLSVQNKVFAIETVHAPGWHWGVLCALFCLGWALVLRVGRERAMAMGAPLALALTGTLLQLALEKAAAPAELLAPFDLAPDRVLFPATMAGAFLLARPGQKIIHLVLYLTLFIAVTRLPLALIGTLATRGQWGTHLDVHATTYFVPPGGGMSIGGIEVVAGGSEQLFWLIWAPQLIVAPFFYMMSTGGLAFLRLMWQRQREVDRATSSSKA